jgi:hypothetical protein
MKRNFDQPENSEKIEQVVKRARFAGRLRPSPSTAMPKAIPDAHGLWHDPANPEGARFPTQQEFENDWRAHQRPEKPPFTDELVLQLLIQAPARS